MKVHGIIVVLAVVIVIALIYFLGQLPGTIQSVKSGNMHGTTDQSTIATTYTSTKQTTMSTSILTTVQYNSSETVPHVRIVSPQNLSTVNGNVTILANITNDADVRNVDFFIGNVLYATVNAQPYSYVWNTDGFADPQYTITVYAYNTANVFGEASVLVDIGLVQHGK